MTKSTIAYKRSAQALAAIGVIGIAATAYASDATGPGAAAVTAKANAVGGLTGDTANPQWTPGGGVFQYYNGGAVAIYWSSATGAHEIYSDILGQFENNGWENYVGYPASDEGDSDPQSWCNTTGVGTGAVREQAFGSNGGNLLCWKPGAPVWRATIPI